MKSDETDRLLTKLKECEERYRSVTETSIDAILTTDASDSVTTWNHGAEVIFGYGLEILGQSVTAIIPERHRKAHREGMARFLKTGEKRLIGRTVELDAIRKNGKEFPIELSLSSWESPSGVFFGAIVRDISERKHMEQIREDVQRMMRHDLRSPLLGITGLTKILEKGAKLTKSQQKALNLIREMGEKTVKLIDRNRDLYQIKEGRYKLTPHSVDLIALLKKIKEELVALRLKKSLDIRIRLQGLSVNKNTTYTIQGDEGLLDVMLTNLIKNAIEASPYEEGITIEIWKNPEQQVHVIDIHNAGVIPEDLKDKFFEPYTTSGKEEGTGLGTHNALLIARAHQGDISFTTSEAKGTHVVVHLPLKIKEEH